MIKEAIKKTRERLDLTPKEMTAVFDEIMSGAPESGDVKEFLLALKAKGESPEEIAAAARIMRERCVRVRTRSADLIDTCGTGGAKINDVNISTLSAIVLAACGLKVAKHGNRSFTGRCGSADIMEALGVDINASAEKTAEEIDTVGIGFIFAKNYHPAMKNVAGIRKELKTRTIFNILGPLSNPAGAKRQIIGVYKPELTEVMARALGELGAEAAYVIHGMEGLDEISIKGKTRISSLEAGGVTSSYISPEDFGMRERPLDGIEGGTCERNKKIVLGVLKGEKGAPRDMVIINAAAALKMTGAASGFKEGSGMAAECIDSGRALAKLDELIRMSRGA